MKVILTKDIDTLGDNGEVLNVSDGYYRNYLAPKNLAVKATEGALADLQSRIERVRAKAEKKHAENQEKAQKIEALGNITIEANAGDTGKLFGTITTKELAKIILEKTGLEVERKQINMNAPMNMIGEYEMYVKFSTKVTATLPVNVIRVLTEEQRAQQQEAAEEKFATGEFDEE